LRRPNPPESRDAAVAPEATQSQAHEECEAGFIVEHAFSASDDPDLVGFSDNVFGGRVTKQVGSMAAKLGGMPADSTRFSVEVLKNVKGRLGGVVTVGQDARMTPSADARCLWRATRCLNPGRRSCSSPAATKGEGGTRSSRRATAT
jgi:hypothetical protein